MTARLRLYAALSLDGCLADGGIGWLAAFEAEGYGMAGFLQGIGAVPTHRGLDAARPCGNGVVGLEYRRA